MHFPGANALNEWHKSVETTANFFICLKIPFTEQCRKWRVIVRTRIFVDMGNMYPIKPFICMCTIVVLAYLTSVQIGLYDILYKGYIDILYIVIL